MDDEFDFIGMNNDEEVIATNICAVYKEVRLKLSQYPDSREKSLAITRLQESCFWAIKGAIIDNRTA